MDEYDLLIIGGGINGVGIAHDAARRGLRVLLCEQGDFASATSSMSSKLIHGGLRYLEHYDFSLVRKALKERDTLLRIAPHIIWPMPFVIPYQAGGRPYWLIRFGLYLYDHLYRSHLLPLSYAIKLTQSSFGLPLKSTFTRGFVYSDCWVDDARLVILNALAAKTAGAQLHSYTAFESAKRFDDHWEITLKPRTAPALTVSTRTVINASGPWVESVDKTLKGHCSKHIKRVKGSHIIVDRLYDGPQAYLLQNSDGRVVFVIPYEQHFTLIGTTEQLLGDSLERVQADDAEKNYLCTAVNTFLKTPISISDVRYSYAGVRPLFADPGTSISENTRDYTFDLDSAGAPLLSIFGGKITTYRLLAQAAVDKLKPYFSGLSDSSTADALLPGAFASDDERGQFMAEFSWLDESILARYARQYGKLARVWLTQCAVKADLGADFGNGFTEREIQYLIAHEMAVTLDDILWRRTKQGLHLTDEQQGVLAAWLKTVLDR